MNVRVTAGAVSIITLTRPERRNALSAEMLDELQGALASIASNDVARCVLLEGEGSHFCAGADFGDVAAGAAQGARYGAGFEALLRAIEDHPLPIVAKVQGAALGAGCQLLTACDLSVAAADATIGVPSARLGLVLDLEKIQRMVRVLGVPTVREMLLSGRNYTGAEAAAKGFVAKSVPAEELAAAAIQMCADVVACAPISVRASKSAIRTIMDHGALDRAAQKSTFALHDREAVRALQSEDLAEGLAALRDRRAPDFKGR